MPLPPPHFGKLEIIKKNMRIKRDEPVSCDLWRIVFHSKQHFAWVVKFYKRENLYLFNATGIFNLRNGRFCE